MNAQRIAAVVPVKNFDEAKQRLRPVLSGRQRRRLARLMFHDVLKVLVECRRLDAVYVVTSDCSAARMARSLGAAVLPDPMRGGLSGAIAHAAQALKARGLQGMLVVPTDVPNIDVAAVERLLDAHAPPRAVTLVAAARDGGTNALLCSPPDVIPNCFGHNSFRAHCQLAASSGIEPNIVNVPGLHYDIDRPLDLLSFLNTPGRTRTYAYLAGGPIAGRLRDTAAFTSAASTASRALPGTVSASLQKG